MQDGDLQFVAGSCAAGDSFIAEGLIYNVLTFRAVNEVHLIFKRKGYCFAHNTLGSGGIALLIPIPHNESAWSALCTS